MRRIILCIMCYFFINKTFLPFLVMTFIYCIFVTIIDFQEFNPPNNFFLYIFVFSEVIKIFFCVAISSLKHGAMKLVTSSIKNVTMKFRKNLHFQSLNFGQILMVIYVCLPSTYIHYMNTQIRLKNNNYVVFIYKNAYTDCQNFSP